MRRFALGLLLVTTFFLPAFAFAASVNPTASDLTVMPGQTATATVSVRNDAEVAKNYEVTFVQTRFGESAEDISFTGLSTSLKSALSATPTLFTLEGHASKNVDVTVRLPFGTEAQSPVIAILITEKGDTGGAGSVQASVASLLFLHIPGDLTRSLAVESFTTVPSFTFGSPVMISGLFKNDGEETVILPNEIRVFGPFGGEVDRGPFSGEPKHLPPGTLRSLSLSWPNGNGFSRFVVGPYRFELWDGDQKLAQTTAMFLPKGILVAGIIGLLLLLLGIIISVRRRT